MSATPKLAAIGPAASLNIDRRPSKSSFIEDHEIDDAYRFVDDAFKVASGGKPLNWRTTGPKVLVKIFIRPEEMKEITNATTGEKHVLYLPDTVRAEDKFNSCVGLVLQVGDQAYTGEDRNGKPRFPYGPWCRVGDWVGFNRNAGKRITIQGVACMILYDDQIDGVTDDPATVAAGHLDFKI